MLERTKTSNFFLNLLIYYLVSLILLCFSLSTTLCLQWEPEIISIALMYLSSKLSKFEVQDWARRQDHHKHWWDIFVEDMTTDMLEGNIKCI